MAANITIKGVEFATNMAGKGALALATFLVAVLKDQKRTKGKIRLRSFEGKPTKVFVMKNSELVMFAKEAKKYGILYAAIVNKKQPDGVCDIIVNANDAARVQRIAEKFELSTVDIEKIKADIEATKANAEVSNETFSLDDAALNEMLNQENQQLNPTMAGTENSNPFVPLLKTENSSDRAFEKPSVRKEIAEMRTNRKNTQNKRQRTKQRTRQAPVKTRSMPKIPGR
jgi:hypothetical protein